MRIPHSKTAWGTRETKQNHLSPASRHAIENKERQSKVIPAQHPDTPWGTRGDEGRQSKVISAQHPDTPWETRGGKETKQSDLSPASRLAMGDKG